MIAVLGPEPDLLQEVAGRIEGIDTFDVAVTSPGFRKLLGEARLGVIVRSKPTDLEIQAIVALRQRFPLLPLLLVTRLNSRNLHRVQKLDPAAAEVVWDDELDRLATMLVSHLDRDPLARLFHRIGRTPGLSRTAVRLVEMICLLPTPPTSVTKAAARIGVSVPTLKRHWAREVTGLAGIKELIWWALLLRWLGSSSHMKVTEAALILNVDPRTLERLSSRLTGDTPIRCATDADRTVAVFEAWVRRVF